MRNFRQKVNSAISKHPTIAKNLTGITIGTGVVLLGGAIGGLIGALVGGLAGVLVGAALGASLVSVAASILASSARNSLNNQSMSMNAGSSNSKNLESSETEEGLENKAGGSLQMMWGNS